MRVSVRVYVQKVLLQLIWWYRAHEVRIANQGLVSAVWVGWYSGIWKYVLLYHIEAQGIFNCHYPGQQVLSTVEGPRLRRSRLTNLTKTLKREDNTESCCVAGRKWRGHRSEAETG